MNKNRNFRSKDVFRVSILLVILAGCSAPTPITNDIATVTPTSTATLSTTVSPVSSYIHYSPEESNIDLEFDYPSSWVFSKEKVPYTDITSIGLVDPAFASVPTRSPDEDHGTPGDFGSIIISIQPVESDQSLSLLVEPHIQGYDNNRGITALNNYESSVDGYDALVFEYQINLGEIYSSTMFERDIFFIIDDQLYQIAFSVAEKDRGGAFEKGYEYFLNSLEIVK
jgi:hypothetical protein